MDLPDDLLDPEIEWFHGSFRKFVKRFGEAHAEERWADAIGMDHKIAEHVADHILRQKLPDAEDYEEAKRQAYRGDALAARVFAFLQPEHQQKMMHYELVQILNAKMDTNSGDNDLGGAMATGEWGGIWSSDDQGRHGQGSSDDVSDWVQAIRKDRADSQTDESHAEKERCDNDSSGIQAIQSSDEDHPPEGRAAVQSNSEGDSFDQSNPGSEEGSETREDGETMEEWYRQYVEPGDTERLPPLKKILESISGVSRDANKTI